MNISDILSLLCQLGFVDSSEQNALLVYAQIGKAIVEAKLKADVDLSDVRLLWAAAGEAFYCYVSAKLISGDEGESIKIGDLAVKNNHESIIKFATNLRNRLNDAVKDMFIDESFAFLVV